MENKQISVMEGSTLELLIYGKDGYYKRAEKITIKTKGAKNEKDNRRKDSNSTKTDRS